MSVLVMAAMLAFHGCLIVVKVLPVVGTSVVNVPQVLRGFVVSLERVVAVAHIAPHAVVSGGVWVDPLSGA